MEWITELIETEAYNYGYHKITICLRQKYGLVVNHKKVNRLCKEMNILKPQRRKVIRYPKRIARNREITGSNQLWETDIKYGYITGEDRFFYILSYLDVFDRSIVDYYIGLTCEARNAVFTLKSALEKRNIPFGSGLVIRSDNGPQFISHVFEGACEELGIEHERIPTKCPNKNAHIEAFHRILEDDCLSCNEFSSYGEAYMKIIDNMDFYNNVRIHSSVEYMTPSEYYAASREGRTKPVVIRV